MHPTTAQKLAPKQLKEIQEWFASIITQPIDPESRISPITPRGVPISEEAPNYVVPSPTLAPWERMQLYNQQYWWRLLKIMGDTFPFVIRQFGPYEFNYRLAMPYLHAYPPCHWSLNTLGNRFVRWLQESYHSDDRQLVIDSAKLDWAFYTAFFSATHPPLTSAALEPEAIEALMEVKLYVQPHVKPFHWKCDLMRFRLEMLKHEVEHWEENDFPEIHTEDGNYDIVLYRNKEDILFCERIHEVEGLLLKRLMQGATTLNQLCEWIERQPQKVNKVAEESLTAWIRHWVVYGWLTQVPDHIKN